MHDIQSVEHESEGERIKHVSAHRLFDFLEFAQILHLTT